MFRGLLRSVIRRTQVVNYRCVIARRRPAMELNDEPGRAARCAPGLLREVFACVRDSASTYCLQHVYISPMICSTFGRIGLRDLDRRMV